MIEVKIENFKDSYYEVKVRYALKSLSDCESLTTFETAFKREVELIERKSVAIAAIQYRLKWIGDPFLTSDAYLELWHRTKKPRHVATIKMTRPQEVTKM